MSITNPEAHHTPMPALKSMPIEHNERSRLQLRLTPALLRPIQRAPLDLARNPNQTVDPTKITANPFNRRPPAPLWNLVNTRTSPFYPWALLPIAA
ncbi:MAG: hypothetical protein IPK82_34955 [Polyangiaceae bacterium]|nr:hypothetical protein [Polyangiaceae bacterium]